MLGRRSRRGSRAGRQKTSQEALLEPAVAAARSAGRPRLDLGLLGPRFRWFVPRPSAAVLACTGEAVLDRATGWHRLVQTCTAVVVVGEATRHRPPVVAASAPRVSQACCGLAWAGSARWFSRVFPGASLSASTRRVTRFSALQRTCCPTSSGTPWTVRSRSCTTTIGNCSLRSQRRSSLPVGTNIASRLRHAQTSESGPSAVQMGGRVVKVRPELLWPWPCARKTPR
mmetsp:Transcript_103685/g.297857  ORF Transcript_103685/g.297857 Transcript_103685/m.297857 type:complete len:228 (-) Transcript_103685:917-1600(-)